MCDKCITHVRTSQLSRVCVPGKTTAFVRNFYDYPLNSRRVRVHTHTHTQMRINNIFSCAAEKQAVCSVDVRRAHTHSNENIPQHERAHSITLTRIHAFTNTCPGECACVRLFSHCELKVHSLQRIRTYNHIAMPAHAQALVQAVKITHSNTLSHTHKPRAPHTTTHANTHTQTEIPRTSAINDKNLVHVSHLLC